MNTRNICWHTRDYSNSSIKVVGGSFGGDLSIETANRLVKGLNFKVIVKPSGTPVFVDNEGREVLLYFSIEARRTEAGMAALKAFNAEKMRQAENEALTREQEEEIADLMEGMDHEEIIRRLRQDE